MRSIIVIFDSELQSKTQVEEPIKELPLDYEIELQDIHGKTNKERKKAFSLLYNHGTDKTPLYLFKDIDIYNSHYFEHGPLNKDVAISKLQN